MRKILTATAISAVAVLGGIGVSAASASASTTPVVAHTISPLHTDTTSVTGGSATQTDPQRGPVWGADRLKETVTATHRTDGKWNVKISFGGSTFAGFADPRSAGEGSADPGGPLESQGNITGSIQYNGIASATAPDPGNVLAVQAPNTSLGTVLGQLFDSATAPPAASTHYLINYTPSMDSVNVTGSGDTWNAGDTYTQAG
jgi:hypothetical protein